MYFKDIGDHGMEKSQDGDDQKGEGLGQLVF